MASSDTDTTNPYRRDKEILSAIWRDQKQEGEEVFFIQRLAQSLVCVCLFVSPATLVRWIGSMVGGRKGRKTAIELYVLFKVSLLAWLLFTRASAQVSQWIAIAGLIDLSTNLGGFVLLRNYWKHSASATRSIILLGVNFFELCIEFAILYSSTGCLTNAAGGVVADPLSIIYFSVITAATVGYGDITPANQLGRLLVILQVALSLGFVAVVLATFVSKLAPIRAKP